MKQRYFRSLSLGLLAALTALACILSACPMGNDDPASTDNDGPVSPGDSITLSGTIGAITVNGASPSGNIFIQAMNQNGNYLESAKYDGSSGAWSISIPSANLASTNSIRFRLEINVNGSDMRWDIPGVTQNYTGKSISGIALGNVSITAVTLSGAIGNVTLNNAPPSGDIYIQAIDDQNGNYLGGAKYDGKSGSWSISIPSANLTSGTIIRFRINIRIGNDEIRQDIPGMTQAYNGSSIPDIALGAVSITTVTLSGTIGTVTLNGAPPSGNINIQAISNQKNNYLGGGRYDGKSGVWSISIPSANLESGTSIRFVVNIWTGSEEIWWDIPEVTRDYTSGDITGIALGNVAIVNAITLSGTVGAVTINGTPYSGDINIQARNQNGNYLGDTLSDGKSGVWSITIPTRNLESVTSIHFQVAIRMGDSWVDQDIPGMTQPYTGGDKDISGIALGNVSINAITLSGTVGAVTLNGNPYSGDIYIQARNKQNGNYLRDTKADGKSGVWSITISTTNLASVTSISFRAAIRIDDSWLEPDIPEEIRPYNGGNITDVTLDNVSITTVTLSGTIGTVTVNGAAPSGDVEIQAMSQGGRGLKGILYDGKSTTWSMTIPTTRLASTTSISFRVGARIGDSWGFHYIPEATQAYNGESIFDIVLGDVPIILER